jgi:hypothetical protein
MTTPSFVLECVNRLSEGAAARLEAWLNIGGKPAAILSAEIIASALVYRPNPFPPYQDDAAARKDLAAVDEQVAAVLEPRVAVTLN